MGITAISFGNTKDAALYFDHVIPLFTFLDAAVDGDFYRLMAMKPANMIDAIREKRDQFVRLLPEEVGEGTLGFEKFVELNVENLRPLGLGKDSEDSFGEDEDTLVLDILRKNANVINGNVAHFFANVPMLNAVSTTSDITISTDNSDGAEIAVTLSGLRLVDTGKVPIEHVMEFRQDHAAVAALRQLRVFAQKEYRGKPESYVEDDLHLKIFEYEQTAKKWGFELVDAGLTTLFNSKSAVGTIGGTIAALLAGSPVIASSAAIVGTALEIGKVTLSVSRKRFEAREALGNDPVSYIARARRHLKP